MSRRRIRSLIQIRRVPARLRVASLTLEGFVGCSRFATGNPTGPTGLTRAVKELDAPIDSVYGDFRIAGNRVGFGWRGKAYTKQPFGEPFKLSRDIDFGGGDGW